MREHAKYINVEGDDRVFYLGDEPTGCANSSPDSPSERQGPPATQCVHTSLTA